jgi:hypothetical protein
MSKGSGKLQRFILETVSREPYRAWPLPALAQLYAEQNDIRPPGSEEPHYTDSLVRSFRRAHVRLPEIRGTRCTVVVPSDGHNRRGSHCRSVTVLYAAAWDIDSYLVTFRMSAWETQLEYYWHRDPAWA